MEKNKIMSVGDWLILMLILIVPIVNIIYIIYYACQNVETAEIPSKVTFCRYLAIMYAILIVLMILVFCGAFLVALVNH